MDTQAAREILTNRTSGQHNEGKYSIWINKAELFQ